MNVSKVKKTKEGFCSPGDKYLTRKDWRNRGWPAGTNDIKAKKEANRKVRRYQNLKSGNSYKKVFEHYDINDFK